MKRSFKLFASLLLMALGISSCGNTATPRPNTSIGDIVESVAFEGIETKNMTLEMDGSVELIPVITYKEGYSSGATVAWHNSNSRVVQLDDNIAVAIGYGSSTISAIAGNKMCSLTITVNKPDVPVHTFELNNSSLSLLIGEESLLSAYYDGQVVNATWATDNGTVATVNNGNVTGISAGDAIITATYNNNTASCSVRVREQGEEFTLTVSPTSLGLRVGETHKLSVTTSAPANVTFSSNKPEVADVDSEGVVTGNGDGSAIITVSANGVSKTVSVSVSSGEGRKDGTVYFFIDYNNYDIDDESKYLACFEWYRNRPLAGCADVPSEPTKAPDPAFPYFIGWSSKAIIDTKDDLWDMEHDTMGTDYVLFIFGIWADVPAGEFIK